MHRLYHFSRRVLCSLRCREKPAWKNRPGGDGPISLPRHVFTVLTSTTCQEGGGRGVFLGDSTFLLLLYFFALRQYSVGAVPM